MHRPAPSVPAGLILFTLAGTRCPATDRCNQRAAAARTGQWLIISVGMVLIWQAFAGDKGAGDGPLRNVDLSSRRGRDCAGRLVGDAPDLAAGVSRFCRWASCLLSWHGWNCRRIKRRPSPDPPSIGSAWLLLAWIITMNVVLIWPVLGLVASPQFVPGWRDLSSASQALSYGAFGLEVP